MTTLPQITGFILSEASETDLDRVSTAVRDRRKALATIRVAAIAVGVVATTRNLSPKYLKGLTGTVWEIKGDHAYLELIEDSTDSLRWARQTRFTVPDDVKTYKLPAGIPLTALAPAAV